MASDGVSESRDDAGAFYPLPDRLAGFAEQSSAALVEHLWEDLVRFCPSIRDDVSVLVLSPGLPEERGGSDEAAPEARGRGGGA